MSHSLRIALAGLGTVGTGIVRIVQDNADLLSARAGVPIEITAVSAQSKGKDRGVDLSGYHWEDDPLALAGRDDYDIFIEAIGGEDGPAKAAIETALAGGKHVITANKALLAHHGYALAGLAEKNSVALRFEAAVAGGIPCVKALTEGLAANKITSVMGVMNGTCNYILTQMEQTGAAYADVLSKAQDLGYAEADPSFDVGGIDAAHKLALLASTAFGTQVDFDGVQIEGIENITLDDIIHARDMGYAIKLLGVARLHDAGLEQRMQPSLVPLTSPFGQLDGVTNMVAFSGDFVGQTVFQGPGAGEGPTASAIIADVVDIARGLVIPAFGQPAANLIKAQRSTAGAASTFYLRFALKDQPGTLGQIATLLAAQDISIDRMRQINHEGDAAPVIIVTHKTLREKLNTALEQIEQLDVSLAPAVALRIEAA